LNLDGIKAAMLYELLGKDAIADPVRLAAGIKALPVRVIAVRPLDEAISIAGGAMFEAMDATLQLQNLQGPGQPVFCAGEMLDWEAPTGGYLLTACFASGRAAGQGVIAHFGL
jgi:predicted flavoprotein YhiN